MPVLFHLVYRVWFLKEGQVSTAQLHCPSLEAVSACSHWTPGMLLRVNRHSGGLSAAAQLQNVVIVEQSPYLLLNASQAQAPTAPSTVISHNQHQHSQRRFVLSVRAFSGVETYCTSSFLFIHATQTHPYKHTTSTHKKQSTHDNAISRH